LSRETREWEIKHDGMLCVQTEEFYSNMDSLGALWGTKTDLEKIISTTKITGRQRKYTAQKKNSKPIQ